MNTAPAFAGVVKNKCEVQRRKHTILTLSMNIGVTAQPLP